MNAAIDSTKIYNIVVSVNAFERNLVFNAAGEQGQAEKTTSALGLHWPQFGAV